MNIIILSGGSGKRLWPLSNEVRSKQFLKIFVREDGTRESMVQRMFRMIKEVDSGAKITIATSEYQLPQIRAQLGDEVNISVEPARRNTFPAITLATAYLKKIGVSEEEPVVVCPVDPYVNVDYFECLKELNDEACKANLTLMGIKPTYPSTMFGYIIPSYKDHIAPVSKFKEKPNEETAKQYIEAGAMWNGGVFAFKLSYLLNITKNNYDTDDYQTLYDCYDNLQNISFDYAVVEKEKNINVIRFNGEWKDLGTWNNLTEVMVDKVSGNSTADYCENTHVINELGIPLIALGIKDAIIAATPDGILVTDKKSSSKLKYYAGSARLINESFCGEHKMLDYKLHENGSNCIVKELIISQGAYFSYKCHKQRSEVWTFTEGVGELIIDGYAKEVHRGDVANIMSGTKCTIKGVTELHIIEVQISGELMEDDIERLD